MSYLAGTRGLDHIGIPSGPPRILCDGCERVFTLSSDRAPPAWFLAGKSPPTWRGKQNGTDRVDWCPDCKGDRLKSAMNSPRSDKPPTST